MWRLGLLVCASCTLVPLQASTSKTASSSSTTSADPLPDGRGPEAGPRPALEPILMPIAERPVDPWVGVSGSQPATFNDKVEFGKRWEVRAQKVSCTAMRDHCLPPLAWLWVHEGDRSPVKDAHVIAFTPEGPSSPHHAKAHINADGFTAYRTVPATRTNLVAGALAAAHPSAIPADPLDAFGLWGLGTVERVDWDLGFLWFVGNQEPRFITAARVAVLSYAPGSVVSVLGGRPRDSLAVNPGDVVVP